MRWTWAVLVIGGLLLPVAVSHAGDKEDSAVCDAKQPEPDDIIAACTRLITGRNKWRMAITYYNRGLAWSRKGKLDNAKSDFDQSIGYDATLPQPYSARASVFFNRRDYDHALADLGQAIRLKPDIASFYINRGAMLQNIGEYTRAVVDYGRAIDLDPKLPHPYAYRGLIYQQLGKERLAMIDCEDSIRLDPRLPNAYYCRAKTAIAFKTGEWDKAKRDIEMAIDLKASVGEFYSLRGQIAMMQGELDRAYADFDKAGQLNADIALTFARRGLTHEKKGDLDGARVEFRRAIEAGGIDAQDRQEAREIATARLAMLDGGQAAPSPGSSTPAPTGAEPVVTVNAAPEPAPSTVAVAIDRRVALVIGNSQYRSVPTLPNPRRDALTVANSLRAIGFQEVRLVEDVTRDALVDALKSFAAESDRADWAMIYYAGHGIEVGGVNYLVPVDARLAADRDVQLEAISLDQVMAATEGARKLHLVILDACRDNPFVNQIKRTVASRSIGRGLAQVEPDSGTLVVYAAKHGQVALDGDGTNSPFVEAFTRRMRTPQVEIRKLFDLVRDDVMSATGRRQQPFSYGSVPGSEDFFFVSSAQAVRQ
jgi:tetratricopeptide (TPR) repeat protein